LKENQSTENQSLLMRDRYTQRVTVRISPTMLAEIDAFVLNHPNTTKNSIIRQSIQSWLNSTPTVPTITIKQPEPAVKNDDPFEPSKYGDEWNVTL